VSRQDELSCISLLETVIQATSTLIVSTYGKRGPISKITSQEGYLFPVGDLIILLTSMTWDQGSSYHIKQPPSTITRYSWHSYIHHPTSSTDVARRIFGQVFTRLNKVITPPTRPLTTGSDTSLLGTDEVKVTLVQEDEDRHTHDWAPIR
jgi:hypothetical protein